MDGERNWADMNSAPQDGRVIHVKRVYEEWTPYEGPAAWRTFMSMGGDRHVMSGDSIPREPITGWAFPLVDQLVPAPTHWDVGSAGPLGSNELRFLLECMKMAEQEGFYLSGHYGSIMRRPEILALGRRLCLQTGVSLIGRDWLSEV